MSLSELEHLVVKAFCKLDCAPLNDLDEASYYSHQDKQELIQRFDRLFEKLKSKGLRNLRTKDSECKFCYTKGNAYSFHHPETDEFIIRYVIAYEGKAEDGETLYVVEECKNNPIPDDIFEQAEKRIDENKALKKWSKNFISGF